MSSNWSARGVLLPALFGVLAPIAAHAQDREVFTWNGRVDREVRLTVSPTRTIASPEESIRSRARFRLSSALPQRAGVLRVVTSQGRGDVEVIQQPSAENGYAAVVRIVDREGGADNYRLTAYWTATEDPRYGRNRDPRRGDNNDNRRDDRRAERENPPMLQWTGDVDRDIQLVWRNGVVRVQQGTGAAPQRVRSTVSGAVGNQIPGEISIRLRDGRGVVDVIQQPSAQNGYTGIIRISDPQSGYGHYNFDAYWR